MPNKAIAGWTQVPIIAKDILKESHERANDAGTATQVTVHYQIRDTLDVVRGHGTTSFQSGSYPTSGAVLLAACNTEEGT